MLGTSCEGSSRSATSEFALDGTLERKASTRKDEVAIAASDRAGNHAS